MCPCLQNIGQVLLTKLELGGIKGIKKATMEELKKFAKLDDPARETAILLHPLYL